MIVLDDGHKYLLNLLDSENYETLTFVKRCSPPEKYPGNTNSYSGTNMQEVIRALINRLKYLDKQIADYRNYLNIVLLRQILLLLEQRAAERHNRKLILNQTEYQTIELLSVCEKCGHIKPEEHKECGN